MDADVSQATVRIPPKKFSVLRRRWRLVAAMALLGVAALWLHFGAPVYRQQQAIGTIQRAGGWVGAREGGPEWLREKVGHERMTGFDEIRAVSLGGTDFTDDQLVCLAALSELRWLSLDRTRITDAGLVRLAHLKHLDTLRLNETRVTDAGLAHLKSLANLKHLFLAGTPVTDAGVADLKRALPGLAVYR